MTTAVALQPLAAVRRRNATRTFQAIAIVLFPVGVAALFLSGPRYVQQSLVICGLIVVFNFVIALFLARNDATLRKLLPYALLFKVSAAGLFLFALYHVFKGGGDAFEYLKWGRAAYLTGFVNQGLLSTGLIVTLTGGLLGLFGDSIPAIVLMFAMVSFWGHYFFYRAFCISFPHGDRELAALLIFFVPSLVFWPAMIGKDAIIFLFIGLTAYGYSLLLYRPGWRTAPVLLMGLIGAGMVRPHIGLMLAVSITATYVLHRSRPGLGGTLVKIMGIVLLAGSTFLLTSDTSKFLGVTSVEGGMQRMEKVNKFNDVGSAAMSQSSMLVRVALVPLLIMRPLPWEVHNPMAGLTSLEGVLLSLFMWNRRREFLIALRQPRHRGFVWFACLYVIQFSFIVGISLSNFGLLARQRVMMLPVLLLPFCVRPERPPLVGTRPSPGLGGPPPLHDSGSSAALRQSSGRQG